jgi:hypothetical protein
VIKFLYTLINSIFILLILSNLFLSPKCYIVNNNHDVKRSHKGTPRHICITTDDYEKALFDDIVKKASYNKIAIERRLGTTTTKSIQKKTVNPIYLKLRVCSDLISTEPHADSNGLL